MDRAVTIADLATGFRRSPATIRGWVRQHRIVRVGTGPHGVAFYDPLHLIRAEKIVRDNTPKPACLTSEAASPNIWNDGRGVPAVTHLTFNPAGPTAGFTHARRRRMADDSAVLTQATVIVTLPNGKHLQIVVVVMPDLDSHSHVELLPDLADAS